MGEPDITLVLGMREAYTLRQGSCELYTFGWGFGAANPPQTPTIGEVRRGPGTLWVPPPHLPNCKADRCQAKPCLSAFPGEILGIGDWGLGVRQSHSQSPVPYPHSPRRKRARRGTIGHSIFAAR